MGELQPSVASEQSSDGFPLHVAIRKLMPQEVVVPLMELCPQALKVQDVDGNTPLHLHLGIDPEVLVGRPREMLVSLARVYPEALLVKNKQGFTPLDLALQTNSSTPRRQELRCDSQFFWDCCL